MLELRIFMGVAASWSKSRRATALAGEILPTKKPDADNVLKAVKDAMNGIVYIDDCQVVDFHGRKRFSDTPRVEVIITPLAKAGTN
ncbi:Endodeoxyribonuclease RusA [compost metagenome]